MRGVVLQAIKGDEAETRKLNSCRYKSHCNSIFCPFCLEQAGYGRKDALYRAAQRVDKGRLRFVTFKALDVPLDGLRDAGKLIMKASRAALKALGIDGYSLSLETSFEEWRDEYHCHTHVLVDRPTGGRNFLSREAWLTAWLTALPGDLHPREILEAAHVRPVRDLEKSCHYLNKSPFWGKVADRETATRTVAVLQAVKGLPRFESRGILTAQVCSLNIVTT